MKSKEALNRARDVIRRQHKAISTEWVYLHWLGRFMAAIRLGDWLRDLEFDQKTK